MCKRCILLAAVLFSSFAFAKMKTFPKLEGSTLPVFRADYFSRKTNICCFRLERISPDECQISIVIHHDGETLLVGEAKLFVYDGTAEVK